MTVWRERKVGGETEEKKRELASERHVTAYTRLSGCLNSFEWFYCVICEQTSVYFVCIQREMCWSW